MQTDRIAKVSAFLALVEKEKATEESRGRYGDFVFRGQRSAWPLSPKLGRLVEAGKRAETEKLIFDEFKRTSSAFMTHPKGDD